MRVGIVNDLRLAAEALRRTVVAAPGLDVAWIAKDGAEAVALCASDPPDVVLMDLVMPTMDGVEATRRIMRETPCPILVVTATVQGNLSKVYEAMSHGALDAVATPVLGRDGDVSGGDELVRKIRTIARLVGREPAGPAAATPAATTRARAADRSVLLAVGCSTGGPGALARILRDLPADLPAAVVVVQHVDEHFADGLADWLDGQSALRVRTIEPGDRPEPSRVLVAATNDHLVLGSDGRFRYVREPV
ncbi:MAG: chemotaxis protein CheB, partial [Alphaproteobacteria bacterium]